MATQNYFINRHSGPHRLIDGDYGYEQHVVDFSLNNVAASDKVPVFNVEAGDTVYRVETRLITPEGGAATGDIGDDGDPNRYDDAINLNTTTNTVTRSLEATDAVGEGQYYSSDDTIDFYPDNALDTAKVEFKLWKSRSSQVDAS